MVAFFADKTIGPFLLRKKLQALIIGSKPGSKMLNIQGFKNMFHITSHNIDYSDPDSKSLCKNKKNSDTYAIYIKNCFIFAASFNNKIMKKYSFLIGIALAISLTACSSNDSGKSANSSSNDETVGDGNLTDQGKVMHLNAEQFKTLVWDYSKNADNWEFRGDLPVIIDFYADWCRPCKMVAPIMDELAAEYKGKIRVYKIDTDKEKELAQVFNVRSIPAVLFIPKEGKPQMSVGALPKPTFVTAIKDVLMVK